MAKYTISYAYYSLRPDGKAGGKTSTQRAVEADSDHVAMKIIESKHPGKLIEWRSIKKK